MAASLAGRRCQRLRVSRRAAAGHHIAWCCLCYSLVLALVEQFAYWLNGASFSLPWACASSRRGTGRTSLRFFFGFGDKKLPEPELNDADRERFLLYADDDEKDPRVQREGLRSLLECTDSFCFSKHWLPEAYVEDIFQQYATEGEGIGIHEFARLARDGLLLKGQVQDYEKAFNAIDEEGTGVITRDDLGRLFAGLGHTLPAEELDAIVEEADVAHDGIDLADFLGLAREHLKLGEVLRYLQTSPRKADDHSLPVDLDSPILAGDAGLGEITELHDEAALNTIVSSGADVVVKLAFTWCRPCKSFKPRYEKFSRLYKGTRFLRIVGNENESTKHYARDVLHAKISPMFAAYSGGKLVDTWTGANNARFIEHLEQHLPSAARHAEDRLEAVASDKEIAPAPA